MFVVTEADEAAIRAVYEQRGEFAAAIELRRLVSQASTDDAQARKWARTIAGWKPLRTVKADASYSPPAVRAAQRSSSHTREADKLGGGLRHARDDTRNAPSDGAGTKAR